MLSLGGFLVETPDAQITLFGYEPRPAELCVRPRTLSRRLRRTLAVLGVTAVAAPVAFLVPPHAPWGLGVLGLGLVAARRRWQETYTVEYMRGSCPHCGEELTLPSGIRLRQPHKLHCEACNHEPVLESDLSRDPED